VAATVAKLDARRGGQRPAEAGGPTVRAAIDTFLAGDTWNRNRAAVGSWLAWCAGRQNWAAPRCPVSPNLVQGRIADLHRTRFSETRGSRLSH
jgi:hypothetical protein